MAKTQIKDRLIGQVIDNFEIQGVLGKGGMGTVYKAYHPALQLYSAVKIMRPDLAVQHGFYERFLQEARTIARLGHPNIVDVINFGKHEDSYYLMMDFIEGPSMRQLVKEHPQGMPVWDVVQIGWQIADVLVYSHDAKVLHRDLKPDNILLTRSVMPHRPYKVIVTDFGLVKLGQGSLLETQEGISLGTPAYMSPEQTRGQDVDGRTDIYALGVLLYEAAAGRRPYPIRNIFDAARFHSGGKLASPRAYNAAVPRELEAIILKMLQPDLKKRTASAAEATDALQGLLDQLTQEGEGVSSGIRLRITSESSEPEEPAEPIEESTTPTIAPVPQAEPSQFFVQVSYEDQWEEKVYPLGDEPIIVGRVTSADIVLDRPGQRYVSRRHCEILFRDKRVLVRDLGSSNGTMLSGEPLQSNVFKVWTTAAEIQLGPFTLALKSDLDLQNVPSPPAVPIPPPAPVPEKPAARAQPAYRLSCPNAVPSRLPLTADHPIIVGRGMDCDMVIEHPHVSKHHCRIQIGDHGVEIVDMRSTNGTILGDQRLPPHVAVPWKDASFITIGPFQITLEEVA